ncbi:UNVERIFIED_CONTAM: hypothetical protein RMT77_011384 [Armadillidium vulgare]
MYNNNLITLKKINILILIFEVIFFKRAVGILLTKESETIVVESGKTDEIILNCPYILEPNDLEGLIVSWFFNDLRYPVYQWIPFQKPQALGFMKEHADLSYLSSNRDYYRYRSIRLTSPSTNLTGKYQCKVSSFRDERNYFVDLVIYSMPTIFKLDVIRKDENSITVRCLAGNAYPEPHLSLYRVSQSKSIPIGDARKQTKWSAGTYSVKFEADVDDIQLDGLTIFECHMTIPQTDVAMKKTIKYVPQTLPNIHQLYTTSSTCRVSQTVSQLKKIHTLLLMFFLLFFI